MKLRNEVHEPSPLAFFRTLSKFSDSTKKWHLNESNFYFIQNIFVISEQEAREKPQSRTLKKVLVLVLLNDVKFFSK